MTRELSAADAYWSAINEEVHLEPIARSWLGELSAKLGPGWFHDRNGWLLVQSVRWPEDGPVEIKLVKANAAGMMGPELETKENGKKGFASRWVTCPVPPPELLERWAS